MTVIGVIYVAGSEPAAVLSLRPDTGRSLELEGDLAVELRRLSGARVEVWGTRRPTGSRDGIVVSDYTVLEVDGHRPLVGFLTTSDGAVWLTGQDSLALSDPQGRLAALAGSKVWILVDTAASPALVRAYGLIRDSPR